MIKVKNISTGKIETVYGLNGTMFMLWDEEEQSWWFSSISNYKPYDPISFTEAMKEFAEKVKTRTNADRIRSMSDEEMAEFLCLAFGCNGECPGQSLCVAGDGKANGLRKWLKNPTQEDR